MIRNNLCAPDHYESEGHNLSHDFDQKNFMHGLHNARNILKSLERSLYKTRKYEQKLLQCKATHSHSHDVSDWWESDISEEKETFSKTGTTNSSRNQVNESWSTMSVVCLQYQYEELTKRYESLLQAYDDRCNAVNSRDATLTRLRQRIRQAYANLAHAHNTLLSIGTKYLTLRRKRLAQKSRYQEKIDVLRTSVCELMAIAQQARLELDTKLQCIMAVEQDAATALLLAEIRKCNLICLENLRLKAQIQDMPETLQCY